jgi:hypothetical protein
MDIAIHTLIPGPHAAHRDLDPETLTDILWANASPTDRLEHIRARACPDGVGVVTFYQGAPGSDPEQAVNGLLRRALSASPCLTGWDLVEQSNSANPMLHRIFEDP